MYVFTHLKKKNQILFSIRPVALNNVTPNYQFIWQLYHMPRSELDTPWYSTDMLFDRMCASACLYKHQWITKK